MTDPNHSTETALAVMATEIKHIRQTVDNIEKKLDTKADEARVNQLDKQKADKSEVENLRRTVGHITKAIWVVGATALTAITTAFLKVIGLIS